MNQSSLLRIRALSLFRYDVADAHHAKLGQLLMPNKLPMARNSLMRGALPVRWEDFVRFELNGQHWHLEYETYANQGFKYFLLPGSEHTNDLPLANASTQGRSPWLIQWQEQTFELRRQNSWRFGFLLLQSGQQLGVLRETTPFLALRHYFEVELPSNWPLELKLFVFYLAVVRVYR